MLPAFLLGLAVSGTFQRHRTTQQRFRVVAFALLTPFFFLRSGMNVSLPLVWVNLGLLGLLLAVKLVAKSTAVYPLARRWAKPHAGFTTLLMSTGLTFGTISATYGYTAGIVRGIEGYGASSRIHTTRLLSLSEDLPIAIIIVDAEHRIGAFLPQLDELVTEGPVIIDPVEVIRYAGRNPETSA